MFTDIKSFSRMMGDDEDLTISLVREHRELFRSILPGFRGQERATAGDSFFVLFNSALEAVNCAIAIQNAFARRNAGVPAERRVVIRIGIHLGDVFYDQQDDDVFGEAINIAARTEPMGVPGSIFVTEPVMSQVRSKLKLPVIPSRHLTMKNIADAPRLFHIAVSDEQAQQIRAQVAPSGDKQKPDREEDDHEPGGDASKKSSSKKGPSGAKKALWITLPALAVIVVIVILTAVLSRQDGAPSADVPLSDASSADSPSSTAARTVMVILPFHNLTGDEKDDWLSLGLAEALEMKLAALESVSIIPAPSEVKKQGGPQLDRWIEQAGITMVASGSYQQIGEQIRINSRLSDTLQGGKIVLTTGVTGAMADIFNLQDMLALGLARGIGSNVTEKTRRDITRQGTRNLEAFKAFAMGLAYRDSGRMIKAVKQFKLAFSLDKRFTRARAMSTSVCGRTEVIQFGVDGSMRHTSRDDFFDDIRDWTTNYGRVIRAEDIQGNTLEVRYEGDMSHIAIPVRKDASEPFSLILELENWVRLEPCEGIFNYCMVTGHYTTEQISNLYELPPGAVAVGVASMPIDILNEDGREIALVTDSRFRHDAFFQNVVFAVDDTAAERVTSLDYAGLVEFFSRMDRPYKAALTANTVIAYQCYLAIQMGDLPRLSGAIDAIRSSGNPYGSFLVSWLRGEIAILDRDDSQAGEFFKDALANEQTIYYVANRIFQWLSERALRDEQPLDVVKLELSRHQWFNSAYFHDNASDEQTREQDTEALLSRIERQSAEETQPAPAGLAQAYDAALFCFNQGDQERCLRLLDGAQLPADNLYVTLLRTRAHHALGHQAEVAGLIQQLVSLWPSRWQWLDHVDMLLSAGRATDALDVLSRTEVAETHNYVLIDYLKTIVARLDNPADHLQAIDTAVYTIYKNRLRDQVDFYLFDLYIALAYALPNERSPDKDDYTRWLMQNIRTDMVRHDADEFSRNNLLYLFSVFHHLDGLDREDREWLSGLAAILYTEPVQEKDELGRMIVTLLVNWSRTGELSNPEQPVLSFSPESVQVRHLKRLFAAR